MPMDVMPEAEVPRFTVWNESLPQSVVRCELDVSAAGPVELRLNSPDGIALYVGAAPVEVTAGTVLDLKPGRQVLTFVIDRERRTSDLRAELDDVTGSPARVAVVSGK